MGCPPVAMNQFAAFMAEGAGLFWQQAKLVTWEPARELLEAHAKRVAARAVREIELGRSP